MQEPGSVRTVMAGNDAWLLARSFGLSSRATLLCMGAHHADDGLREDSSGDAVKAREDEQPKQSQQSQPSRKPSFELRAVWGTVAGVLAGLVRWTGLLLAVVLVANVLFVVGEGNPGNGIVSFVADAAEVVSIGFDDLFLPEDRKLRVLINHGVAAVFWLVATSLAVKIIRSAGGRSD